MALNERDETSDKKQAIFESTLELIRTHGFHGTPMSLVAKTAGVAAGTIYHYFKSKEQLICDLYHHNKRRIVKVTETAINKRGTFKEKFFLIWTSLYNFYLSEPNILIFFEQFVNSPFNAQKFPVDFRGRLYDFFSDGIKGGHIKPVKPEIILVLFMGSINATAKLNVFRNVELTKSDLNNIVEILWQGVAGKKNGTA